VTLVPLRNTSTSGRGSRQTLDRQVGWIVTQIDDPGRGAETSSIDAMFEEFPGTLTTAKAMSLSFMGMFSAILFGMDVVSMIILAIMARSGQHHHRVANRPTVRGAARGRLPAPTPGPGDRVGQWSRPLGALVGLGLGCLLINGMLGPFIEEHGRHVPYAGSPRPRWRWCWRSCWRPRRVSHLPGRAPETRRRHPAGERATAIPISAASIASKARDHHRHPQVALVVAIAAPPLISGSDCGLL
jgi:hypothetical protein